MNGNNKVNVDPPAPEALKDPAALDESVPEVELQKLLQRKVTDHFWDAINTAAREAMDAGMPSTQAIGMLFCLASAITDSTVDVQDKAAQGGGAPDV